MTNPFAPPKTDSPNATRSAEAAPRRRWLPALDLFLLVALVLLLLPAVLFNAVLWLERLQGFGIYDPTAGGDPAWQHRPLKVPLLVAAAAAVRLALAYRGPSLSALPLKGYVIMLVTAILTTAAALIPEPSFFPP